MTVRSRPATPAASDAETLSRYRQQGFAQERIGFGSRPALLIVDMQNDFVDPAAPSTCAPLAQEALPSIKRLLEAARAAGIPVFFSQGVVAPDLSDVGLWKSRPRKEGKVQIAGSRGAAIVEALAPLPHEEVVRKRRPSAFFGTELDVLLRARGIDTVILAGSSMSGCVRATALDAFSHDYRTMVVRECVVDRTQALIDTNLFDVDAKYADAVSLADTLEYLARNDVRGAAKRTRAG